MRSLIPKTVAVCVTTVLMVGLAAPWAAAEKRVWASQAAAAGLEAGGKPSEGNQAAATQVQLRLIVKSSPQAIWESAETVTDSNVSKAWSKREELASDADPRTVSEQLLPFSDTVLEVQSAEGTLRTGLGSPSIVADLDTGKQWRLSRSAWNKLREQAIRLRLRHYGELLDWRDAQTKVPRQSVFQVTDLETGLSFRVQRRAGSQHADVQPMTKADSAVMKQIYGGAWSWKRRAILVRSDDDSSLAASMHGMPHGGGRYSRQ